MSIRDYLIADDAAGNEYVIRRAHPRFIARVVDETAEGVPLDAVTARLDDDTSLSEFEWWDGVLSAAEIADMLPEIREFLEHVQEVDERRIEADELRD